MPQAFDPEMKKNRSVYKEVHSAELCINSFQSDLLSAAIVLHLLLFRHIS